MADTFVWEYLPSFLTLDIGLAIAHFAGNGMGTYNVS